MFMVDKTSFNRDYKAESGTADQVDKIYKRFHWILLGVGAVTLVSVFGLLSNDAEAMRGEPGIASSNNQHTGAVAAQRTTLPLQLPPQAVHGDPNDQEEQADAAGVYQVTIQKGDTLSEIFDRLHLSPQQLHAVLSLDKNTKKTLVRLIPGQTMEVRLTPDGALQQLDYKLDDRSSLVVQRENGELRGSQTSRQYEKRVTFAKGSIENSLFEAAQKAGLSDSLTMEMAGIFGWDVDFALDIREGDSFVVMYEELYLDGEKVRDGRILAAEFVNQGKRYRAVRYADAGGKADYYTPDGKSMRKAFLRTPVDFTRISSRFGTRFHPVLNRMRAHKGVDYAAPKGTPVRASGDGKVIFRGRKGGYGNTIVIQHGNTYSTLYAHLSRFARGIYSGKRVRQGQVIAYVGKSGLATGPHLHYEFRVNGVHRNPLTVRLPNAAPVNRKFKAAFETQARGLLTQLDMVANPTVFSAL